MHASIRKYRINTDAVAALAVRVEDGFVPIISKLPGFVSYMVVDGGDGNVASISIFENEEAAEQSNAAAAEWVKENLSDVITEAQVDFIDYYSGSYYTASFEVSSMWTEIRLPFERMTGDDGVLSDVGPDRACYAIIISAEIPPNDLRQSLNSGVFTFDLRFDDLSFY